MALDVVLALSEEDQRRLDRLAAIRKDEEVWRHERKYEKDRRAYLGGDVLLDTGSAVVWWLTKNDDQVEKTVKDIGLLARLTSAANNEQVAEPFRHLVPEAFPKESATETERGPADLFTDFLRQVGFSPGDDECVMIADQVAMAIKDKDSDAAEEIRTLFAPPPVPVAENENENGDDPDSPSTDIEPVTEA